MKHEKWLYPIVLSCACACGSKTTQGPDVPPSEAATAEPVSQSQNTKKPGDDPAQSDINISDAIKKACGLSETEAHFAYNSANVQESDRQVLKKLSDCFTTGPLKGRQMNLVGHADPRGEAEYNMILGEKRAENVSSALVGAGLPSEQVTTTSRGEMDATGTDEASWARDRRVDINLAD